MKIFARNKPNDFEKLHRLGNQEEDSNRIELVRHLKKRKDPAETKTAVPPSPERSAENDTEIKTATQDAQSTYEDITKGLEIEEVPIIDVPNTRRDVDVNLPKTEGTPDTTAQEPPKIDETVRESADLISGRMKNFTRGARNMASALVKAATCIGAYSIPLIGPIMMANNYFKKDSDTPSYLSKICDGIDNIIVGDGLGFRKQTDLAYEDAHKTVATAFTKHKDKIAETLKDDKAAILGLQPKEMFVLDTLDNIYGKELEKETKKLTAEKKKEDPKIALENPTTELETTQAKRVQGEIDDKAEEKAEKIAKEKRLLAVRALTEGTDLVEVLKDDKKIDWRIDNTPDQTNLDQFLALEPAQMRQVIEAFHLKDFNPESSIEEFLAKQLGTPSTGNHTKSDPLSSQDKFQKALEHVTTSFAPTTSTDNKDKIKSGKNILGNILWQYETAGAGRMANMARRKAQESIWSVGAILSQWTPQIKTAGLVVAGAAGHYIAENHFKPKTS